MKISASKKQLAKIISENGGWREGVEFSVSTCDGVVIGSRSKPRYTSKYGWVASGGFFEGRIKLSSYLKNWHQTILSRDEYFHLYPVPDAAAEELEHVWTNPPTIEQLAAEYRNRKDYAERKQQEADAAKAEADVKLAELVAAGKAVGLAVSVAAPEPELVITDWRDLQVGDEIATTSGRKLTVTGLRQHDESWPISAYDNSGSDGWCVSAHDWRFIRRPSKEADNA